MVLPVLAALEQRYLLRLAALLHWQLVLFLFVDLLFELLKPLLSDSLGPQACLVLEVFVDLKPGVELLAA